MIKLISKLLFLSDKIEKSLDTAWARNEVISENIANADTPGYKRKEVQFDELLTSELKHSRISNGKSRLGNRGIKIVTDNQNYSYRLDGNNVDIEREMAIMAENTMKYYTLIQRISGQFNKIRSIIKGG